MSEFRAICPYCQAQYILDSSLSGKKALCQKCRKKFRLLASPDENETFPKHSDQGAEQRLTAHLPENADVSRQGSLKRANPNSINQEHLKQAGSSENIAPHSVQGSLKNEDKNRSRRSETQNNPSLAKESLVFNSKDSADKNTSNNISNVNNKNSINDSNHKNNETGNNSTDRENVGVGNNKNTGNVKNAENGVSAPASDSLLIPENLLSDSSFSEVLSPDPLDIPLDFFSDSESGPLEFFDPPELEDQSLDECNFALDSYSGRQAGSSLNLPPDPNSISASNLDSVSNLSCHLDLESGLGTKFEGKTSDSDISNSPSRFFQKTDAEDQFEFDLSFSESEDDLKDVFSQKTESERLESSQTPKKNDSKQTEKSLPLESLPLESLPLTNIKQATDSDSIHENIESTANNQPALSDCSTSLKPTSLNSTSLNSTSLNSETLNSREKNIVSGRSDSAIFASDQPECLTQNITPAEIETDKDVEVGKQAPEEKISKNNSEITSSRNVAILKQTDEKLTEKNAEKQLTEKESTEKKNTSKLHSNNGVRKENGHSKQKAAVSPFLFIEKENSNLFSSEERSVSQVPLVNLFSGNGIKKTTQTSINDSAALVPWKVGDLVMGIYEVLPLSDSLPYAEGGVGMVHRILHHDWNMELAVKSPKPGSILTENGKQSFEKECQTWIELGLHTNIVTCYLVRRIDGVPRLFAELVPDGTLREWIVDGRLYEGGPDVALRRIFDIAIQFAWGLDYAHQQGLLHLDVKPGNVMMSGNVAKVTDFGLAKVGGRQNVLSGAMQENDENSSVLSATTCEGMTPSYCSPEQYEAFLIYKQEETGQIAPGQLKPSQPMTVQSDIWSWAISVLAMFHGRSPCKKGGQTAAEVFELFLKTNKPQERPAFPDELVPLFRYCFQKEAALRPKSMDAVAESLTQSYQKIFGEAYPRKKPISSALTSESLCNRAASMLDLNRPMEALTLLNQAWKMNSGIPEIVFNQTLLSWRYGKITDLKALQILQELTKHRAMSETTFYGLGLLQRERGNIDAALECFEKAFEMDENRNDIHICFNKTNGLAKMGVKCLARNVIARTPDGISPFLLMDADEKYFIALSDAQSLMMFENGSGNILLKFRAADSSFEKFLENSLEESGEKSLDKSTDQSTRESLLKSFDPGVKETSVETCSDFSADIKQKTLALTDDYLWELVSQDGTDEIRLRFTGDESVSSNIPHSLIFHQINWNQNEKCPYGRSSLDLFSKENELILADRENGTTIRKYIGHEDQVTAFALDVSGQFMISGSRDQSLRIWNIETGCCIRTFIRLGGFIESIYLSKNGTFALTVLNGNQLRLWDLRLIAKHGNAVHSPVMLCTAVRSEEIAERQSALELLCGEAKDAVDTGNYLLATHLIRRASEINGWETIRSNLPLLKILARHTVRAGLEDVVSHGTFVDHDDDINGIALSNDGQILVSGGRDFILRCWKPNGSLLRRMKGHYDWIRTVDITGDGSFVVSGSWDQTIRVWNLKTGELLQMMDGKIRNITAVRFASDGRTVAVASGSGEISLWDGGTGVELDRWTAHQGYIQAILFSRDGRYLLSCGEDQTLRLWNAKTKFECLTLRGHKSKINAIHMSADLQTIISADAAGMIFVWNLDKQKTEPVLKLTGHLGEVTALAVSLDEHWLFSGSRDGTVRIWNLADGKTVRILEGASPVSSIAIDWYCSYLYVGYEDGTLRSWRLFWKFRFDRRTRADVVSRRVLGAITAFYRRNTLLQNGMVSLQKFYAERKTIISSNKTQETEGLSWDDQIWRQNPLPLDEKSKLRILLEMELRGFGNISPPELENILVSEWNAPFITFLDD